MSDLYMDRSEYILKRLVLLHNWEAPTISDVTKNFGDDLAEKIFCNCDASFREHFGLEPPLKGPMGSDLWSSPSDLLIGKVCLKPPFTSKHIRALTHQGILEIGLKIEKLFWNQLEIEKSKELEEQERTLKLLCETAKRKAIAEVRHIMMENFRSERLDIVTELEAIFKEERLRIEEEYRNNLQEKLNEQSQKLKDFYEAMLEEEKLKSNEVVSTNRSIDLEEIETTLKTSFQTYFQKAQMHANFKIQSEQARCKEKLKTLRHELECKNLANLMYVMCMERKKCYYENSLVKTDLAKEINNLSGLLQDSNKETEKLIADKVDLQKNVEMRDSALSKIIEEFQKFIYFALKAEPKQAEYLLSGEKLLLYELINELSKAASTEDKDDDHDRNYVWNKTPPRTDSAPESLLVKDGHECLKEPEITESELSVEQFLPGFHYSDQLFVREDFRNMVSQGIKLVPNDMLWTKQVQAIQDEMELPAPLSALDGSREIREVTKKVPAEKKKSLLSFQSSVHFSVIEKDKSSIISEDQIKRKRTSIKTIEPEDVLRTVDFGTIGSEERRKTLISTKNSVELMKENILKQKSSLRMVTTLDEVAENESVVKRISDETKMMIDTRDSVVNTKMKQVLTSVSGMQVLKSEEITDPKKTYSRLITVTDSVEIIKQRRSSRGSYVAEPPQFRPTISDEITFKELQSDNDDNISQPLGDPPRRVSIVFTGKSVVYDEQNQKEINQQPQKLRVRENQKRKPPRKLIQRLKTTKKISDKSVPETRTQTQDGMLKQTEQIVVGDSKFKFSQQNEAEFSNGRINSFLNIIKEHPNLIRLFTSVTR